MKLKYFALVLFCLLSVPAIADSVVGTVRTIEYATNNGDIRLRIKKAGTPTDAMTVQGSSAFVGIGSTSPVAKLHVENVSEPSTDTSGLNTGILARNSTVNASVKMYPTVTGTNNSAIQSADFSSSVNTEGGTRNTSFNLLLNPFGGRVGVGTTSPAQLFDVRGTGTNSAAFAVVGNSTASDFIALGSGRTGDAIARIQFSSALTQMDFGTSPDSSIGSVSPLATLLTTGNFGVGTQTPATRLQSLDASAAQGTFSGWDSVGGAATGNGELHVGATAAGQASVHYDATSNSNMYIDNTKDSASAIIHIRTRTAGTAVEGIVVRGDGNVAIGTTSAVHKFSVRTASADNNVAIDDTGAGPTIDFRNDANSAYRPGSLHGTTLNLIGTSVNVGSATPVHTFSVHTSTNNNLAVDDSAGTTVDFRNDANSAYVAGTVHGSTLTLTAASGISLNGPTSVAVAGGNVPYTCVTRTNAGSGTLTNQACSAGERVVGGGCAASLAANPILQSIPCGNFNTADYSCSTTPDGIASTNWRCQVGGGVVTAYAICCTQ